MAVASSHQALLTRTEDAEAGLLQRQNIQVQELGTRVVVGNYMYCKTNFYIDQSRKYVGKRKLTKYFYIKWLHWYYIPILLGSFFAPFNYIATFVMFGVNLLVFIVYTQHMYVNLTTMWHVLKQPSLPDHRLSQNNAFFEIQLDQFEAMYAASHRAGIGFVAQTASRQTVKFQVFRKSAMQVMKNCIYTSTLCFIASFFMFLYCYIWGICLLLEGRF